WAIAIAASANGRRALDEFNARYGRRIAWLPWQRPGFELALMLRRAVDAQPDCDGIVLGSHGLFTWGTTQAECYRNSIRTIDQMGQLVGERARRRGGASFGGAAVRAPRQADEVVAAILPHLRGAVSSNRRVVAHVERGEEALWFANSAWAADLCALGTSCPDHFLRTRISPLFVPWNPDADDGAALQRRIDYWALEEAKLQRTAAEKEFSRKIALVFGGGSGIGREVALQLARRGAHVVVADLNAAAAEAAWHDARALSSPEHGFAVQVDLSSRDSIARALEQTVLQFGGVDIVVNTAAIYPAPEPDGAASEAAWSRTLLVNVTSNHLLAETAAAVMRAQHLAGSIVLTSSANAIVPKHGSEPYDVSKAAVNHLIRELAIGLGPA